MMFKRTVSLLVLTTGVFFSSLFLTAEASPASPFPLHVNDGDESLLELYAHGNSPENLFLADVNGYTVLEERDRHDGGSNNSSRFVYAMRNVTSGDLISSGIVVGQGDPSLKGIPKRLRPFSSHHDQTERHLLEHFYNATSAAAAADDEFHYITDRRRLNVGPVLRNLVVLVRFANHGGRRLPPPNAYRILFGQVDPANPNHPLAPTGSVKDVFTVNSYGKMDLQSEVYGWINLPQTEAYYANGISGFGRNSRYFEALQSAMDSLQDQFNVNFNSFDADGNGRVDCVTLIHSGYAAEIFGSDVDGATSPNRIWSHRWRLPSREYWNSGTGVVVDQYSTSPALFGLSGSNIGRIGVIAHEIGHCIGIPDLYGTPQGNGIGNYDFMANHWGFAPYQDRQLYPPIMSPWTKMLAGWLEPITISTSGTYSIAASESTEQIYRIDLNGQGNEYLLIENRQPVYFDSFLPIDPLDPLQRRGGLAIWHIDEGSLDVEGYPGQDGIWPFNGKHYDVALLQADGNYDLERGHNLGDSGDLFHQNGHGVDILQQSINILDGPFPNTDSYRGGFAGNTGIRIRDIGPSAPTMSFTVDFLETLPTTFRGGNGASGNMFDVFVREDIVLRALSIHLAALGPAVVEVWSKTGSHVTFENNPLVWNRIVVNTINGNGRGKKSRIELGEVSLRAGDSHSFYVFVLGGRLRYTNGNGVGTPIASNTHLLMLEGVGKASPFGVTFADRIWNGEFLYEVV